MSQVLKLALVALVVLVEVEAMAQAHLPSQQALEVPQRILFSWAMAYPS